MGDYFTRIGKTILNHDFIVRKGNISGSATSTGSFGMVGVGQANPKAALHIGNKSEPTYASQMEVGNSFFFGGGLAEFKPSSTVIFHRGGSGLGASFQDDTQLSFGELHGGEVRILWETAESADAFHILIESNASDASGNIIIGERGSLNKAFDHPISINPTLFIHSSTDPDADNTQWLGFTHESGSGQLSASISTGKSDIKFSPSGSDVLFLSGSGNVGIGTTDPQYNLDVAGALRVGASSYNIPTLIVAGANQSNDLEIIGGNVTGLAFVTDWWDTKYSLYSSYTSLYIEDMNTDIVSLEIDVSGNVNIGDGRLYVTRNTGNVGIGTTSPGVALEVIGSISGSATSTGSFGAVIVPDKVAIGRATLGTAELVVQDGQVQVGLGATDGYGFHDLGTGWGYKGATSPSRLGIFTDNNERITISGAGKVGIGTTSPSKLLHVAGDAQIDGTLTAQEFHTEFVSASIIFSSGSTKFGDTSDDIHQFSGSVYISGSGDGLTITSPSSDYGIRFKTPTGNRGRIGSDAAIILFNESALTLTAGSLMGTALGKINTNLLPISDATYNLGSGTYRWNEVYGDEGYFGAISGSSLQVGSTITSIGNISGSATSTGSFGSLIVGTNGGDGGPDITFAGDSDTGFYWHSAGSIGWTANGSDALRVTSTGMVNAYQGISLPTTKILYLDGGDNTFIRENGADNIQIYAGGVNRLNVSTAGVQVTGIVEASGNISGSATSTGSFGTVQVAISSSYKIGNDDILSFGNYHDVTSTAVGYRALVTATGGGTSANVAVGWKALEGVGGRYGNVAVGYEALQNNSGNYSVAIGQSALKHQGSGYDNVAIGHNAMLVNSRGDRNVAIGKYAFINIGSYDVGEAERNVAIGYNAGQLTTSGSGNIFIGYEADPSINSGVNQIVIGSGSIGIGHNTTVIGNDSTTVTYLRGNISGSATSTGSFGSLETAGNSVFTGTLTANAGIIIDNVTLDANKIATSTGNFTIDSASDIILDAGSILIDDDGTRFGTINRNGDNLKIISNISDGDLKLSGNDGGSSIDALVLDMSEGGRAIFASDISGSATSTGSFGKVTIGGPVFNDVSASRHSALTIYSPSGNYATGSAITIVGDSTSGRQRINWDMDGDDKVYSYIEARGQGGGDNRGQLFFATRNGGRTAQFAAPRMGINSEGHVAIMATTGDAGTADLHATELRFAGAFQSASLAVFTGDTYDASKYAGWFENRVDSADRNGIYVSAVRDGSAIIRAAKRTFAGVETKVFEVLANGQISGSSTSTGSFGDGFFNGKVIIGGGESPSSRGVDIRGNVSIRSAKSGGNSPTFNGTLDVVSQGGNNIIQLWDDNETTIPRFLVERTGNVGIGTTSPSKLLHVAGDAQIDGTLTAQEFHTEFVSASIIFSSGSTKFGDTLDDIHQFTGSLFISASRIDFTDGKNNTFLGKSAGASITTGKESVVIGSLAGDAMTDSGRNTLIGYEAGSEINSSTADGMVAVGYQAAYSLTTASDSVAIGFRALKVHTTGGGNIAIGYRAMQNTNAGSTSEASSNNIFIGKDAGGGTWANAASEYNVGIGNYVMDAAMNGAQYNTALGDNALTDLTTGDYNVALGSNAGFNLTIGSQNIIIGRAAGQNSTGMNYTVLIGTGAGSGVLTSAANGTIAIGYQAGYSITSGIGNVAIGYEALLVEDDGDYNTAIGYQSLKTQNIDSGRNTAIGYKSGTALTSGTKNTIIGAEAMSVMTTAIDNIAIGKQTLQGQAGQAVQYNVAIGNSAMQGNAITTGTNGTVAIGSAALTSLTSGAGNTAIGYQALASEDAGGSNTAVGYQALDVLNNDVGGNTALGDNAGGALTTGYQNTFIGNEAGGGSSAVQRTVIIGNEAARSTMTSAATGTIAIGHQVLYSLSSGAGNIAIGYLAGTRHSTGTGNIFIGYNAATGSTTGDYNTVLGYEAYSTATELDRNTAIGYQALKVASGSAGNGDNTAVGYLAGAGITTSTRNVAVGAFALSIEATGTNNVAIGFKSFWQSNGGEANTGVGYGTGYYNATGDNNTYVGNYAGFGASGQSNSHNTAVGRGAMESVTSGGENVVIGSAAGNALTTGANNVIIGKNAGNDAVDLDSAVLIGHSAGGTYNMTDAADGIVAIGNEALKDNITGEGNVAVGHQALMTETDLDKNTAIGYQTLRVASGSAGSGRNTAVGYRAMDAMTSGVDNIAMGVDALGAATGTGCSYNIAIGNYAMDGTISSNSIHNVAIGYSAMSANMTDAADYNTAVGSKSGRLITTGNENVFIGFQAGDVATSGYRNTVVGYDADLSANNGINQIVIGKDAVGHGDNIAVIGDTNITAWHPADDAGVDLGSSNYRFANLYTADIQLSNEGANGNEVDGTTGNWTIQEGKDDIFIINRKTGKKFRFKLEEIE